MGFERVTAVLQGKTSNYDTDVFTPIFEAIQKVTGAGRTRGKLDDLKDTAYRVIADHIRALTFALTDGARAEQREAAAMSCGSILRRAERYGRQYLDTTKPFLHELVPTVVEVMGGAFPELKTQAERGGASRSSRRKKSFHPHARPRHQAVSRKWPSEHAQRTAARSSAARMRSSCTRPTASSSTSPSRWRRKSG